MKLRTALLCVAMLGSGMRSAYSQTTGPTQSKAANDECEVRRSAGIGQTVLLSFSGEVKAEASYQCDFTPRLTFALLPIAAGWQIVVMDRGRTDNLAAFSEPLMGFDPLRIEAQQFQGKEGNPEGANAAPSDLRNRQFIFSVQVGRAIKPPINGAATPEQIEQITKEGQGTLKIKTLELTHPQAGQAPEIAQMAFDVSIRLAGKNLEPGGGVFRLGGGVSPPKIIYAPDPEYDETARKQGIQGTVVLWLIVGPDGLPREIKVARSLGHGLDEKAIEAVRRWRFEPSVKDGQPVAVKINVEVQFRLYHGPRP